MQIPIGSTQRWLVLLPLVVLALTACATPMTPASRHVSSDRSAGWNDTTAHATAEAMVQEALQQPWPRRFTQITGRTPVVSVGTVVNRTSEQLNTQTFVTDLERVLADSRQVQVVAKAGPRQKTPRTDTVQPAGQELGADFMLQGVINILGDERDSTQAGFYQVELEIVDLASNVQVWQGQKNIKKL